MLQVETCWRRGVGRCFVVSGQAIAFSLSSCSNSFPLSSGAFALMLVYGECPGCPSRRLKASLSVIKTARGRIREHPTDRTIIALSHSLADETGKVTKADISQRSKKRRCCFYMNEFHSACYITLITVGKGLTWCTSAIWEARQMFQGPVTLSLLNFTPLFFWFIQNL